MRRVNKVEQEFLQFHRANPQVYRMLVQITRSMLAQGRRRLGIGDVYERLRYHIRMATNIDPRYYQPDGKPMKLANAHRAYYARLIMQQEPDLKDVFVVKPLRTQRYEINTAEPLEQTEMKL